LWPNGQMGIREGPLIEVSGRGEADLYVAKRKGKTKSIGDPMRPIDVAAPMATTPKCEGGKSGGRKQAKRWGPWEEVRCTHRCPRAQ
jgi:hypothetical protein